MKAIPRWVDIPPMWLLGFLIVTWQLRGIGVSLPGWTVHIGTALVTLGLVLIGWAVVEFARARTSVIPGMQPSAIVTSGPFRYTRNPIYLADVVIFVGLILRWDAVIALPLVAVFVWVITVRFIAWEESQLAQTFPDTFVYYCKVTRKWL